MQGKPSSGRANYEPTEQQIADRAADLRSRVSPIKERARKNRIGKLVHKTKERLPRVQVDFKDAAERSTVMNVADRYGMSVSAYCRAMILGLEIT